MSFQEKGITITGNAIFYGKYYQVRRSTTVLKPTQVDR